MTSSARMIGTVLALLVTVSGCSKFPELDAKVPQSERRGPYPKIVPIAGVLTQTEDPQIEDGETEELEDRAADLRARADALNAY